jgi:predicted nucleic acid-binding protein
VSFEPGANDAKRLVLDANILMRSILGKRVRALIQEHANQVRLFAPDVAFADAQRYLPPRLAERGVPPPEAGRLLDELLFQRLPQLVTPVPRDFYEGREIEARQRMVSRDEADWPFVALALTLDCPTWTEDRDFFGSGVATWTTDRIQLY